MLALSPEARRTREPTVGTGLRPLPRCECERTRMTLQALIDAAPAGSFLRVPPGIYHETVVIRKPLTLDGKGQASIRGSDVWASWSPIAVGWLSDKTVPVFGTANQGTCAVDHPSCNAPEQVFVDGTPTAFSLDGDRHVILKTDPTGHTVEVSVRERWIDTQSDHVTIQGLTFWHAANAAETGAIGNQNRDAWTLQDCNLYYAHGGIVSLGGATNVGTQTRVLRCDIAGSGCVGINGYMNSNTLIQRNTIYDNNQSGFDSQNWGGGGVK